MVGREGAKPLRALELLVGRWTIRGRSVGADEDNIAGESETVWSPDRSFLEQRTTLRIGEDEVHALEIIGHEPGSDVFPAWVFSAGAAEPLRYRWRIEGNLLIHAGLGATFTGQLSPDRRTIRGSWRPDDARTTAPGSAYDAVMTRVDRPTQTEPARGRLGGSRTTDGP